MKTILNTLKPILERWDDPGDYPSNAGSGPLPSYDYVEYIDGQIVVEFATEDLEALDGETVTVRNAVEDWLSDNGSQVEHDVSGLTVKKWLLKKLEGHQATLEVEEFECEVPEHEPDYERGID
jgi:hypothetical protein